MPAGVLKHPDVRIFRRNDAKQNIRRQSAAKNHRGNQGKQIALAGLKEPSGDFVPQIDQDGIGFPAAEIKNGDGEENDDAEPQQMDRSQPARQHADQRQSRKSQVAADQFPALRPDGQKARSGPAGGTSPDLPAPSTRRSRRQQQASLPATRLRQHQAHGAYHQRKDEGLEGCNDKPNAEDGPVGLNSDAFRQIAVMNELPDQRIKPDSCT